MQFVFEGEKKKENENARKEYTLCLLMNGKKNI